MAEKVLAPFTCPNCGKTVMVNALYINRRKYCDECSPKIYRKNYNADYKGVYDNLKKVEKPTRVNAEDEENKRLKEWAKFCQGCWFWREYGPYCFCDYRSWHNHGPKRGAKPGECESFIDREEYKAMRLEKRRKYATEKRAL